MYSTLPTLDPSVLPLTVYQGPPFIAGIRFVPVSTVDLPENVYSNLRILYTTPDGRSKSLHITDSSIYKINAQKVIVDSSPASTTFSIFFLDDAGEEIIAAPGPKIVSNTTLSLKTFPKDAGGPTFTGVLPATFFPDWANLSPTTGAFCLLWFVLDVIGTPVVMTGNGHFDLFRNPFSNYVGFGLPFSNIPALKVAAVNGVNGTLGISQEFKFDVPFGSLYFNPVGIEVPIAAALPVLHVYTLITRRPL